MDKVFISYSGNDSEWAREFAESLREHGVKVWLDQFEVAPGAPLAEAIERGLRESDLVVTLVSPESLDRPALFFELGAAISMGKRVVGVIPDGIDESLLPLSLRKRRYLRKQSPRATAAALLSQAA